MTDQPSASIGVDPGKDGAWVSLRRSRDGGGWRYDVTTAVAWRRLGRAKCRGGRFGWRFGSYRDIGSQGWLATNDESTTLYGLLGGVRMGAVGALVVVEGLFGRGVTLERLAESAGGVLSAVDDVAFNDVTKREWRPLARTWRPVVLGCPPMTPSEVVDRLTLEWVYDQGYDLGMLVDNPHAREALCLAAYGWQLWGER